MIDPSQVECVKHSTALEALWLGSGALNHYLRCYVDDCPHYRTFDGLFGQVLGLSDIPARAAKGAICLNDLLDSINNDATNVAVWRTKPLNHRGFA